MGNDWFELADPGHFWIQWRFQVLRQLIAGHLKPETRVLEIGCGNGLVMWQMEKFLNVVSDGCDLNVQALEAIMPVSGKVYLYDIFDLNPELVGHFDIVMMLDVLEHIDDDRLFLQTAMKYLKPGGLMVVGVPAHQKLFSKYDRLMGHFRRYERKELRQLFQSAGLQDMEVCFWGFSILPIMWLRKIYLSYIADKEVVKSGFKPPHPLFNRLMLAVMSLETAIFRRAPGGISLMAVAKRHE